MNMTFIPSGNLKQFRRGFFSAVALLLTTTGPSRAEDTPEAGEVPIELIRLRQQFQSKVDQEMAPWREKYSKELQKLEDRLIQERKLKEALAVKAERENEEAISTKPATGATVAGLKAPESPAEAKKVLTGTVWLVYAAEDKKRETLLDVYHFVDSSSVFVFSSKRNFSWSAKTVTEFAIKFLAGDIKMTADYAKATGISTYADRGYTLVLAGRPSL